jgi:hypothetical protein
MRAGEGDVQATNSINRQSIVTTRDGQKTVLSYTSWISGKPVDSLSGLAGQLLSKTFVKSNLTCNASPLFCVIRKKATMFTFLLTALISWHWWLNRKEADDWKNHA